MGADVYSKHSQNDHIEVLRAVAVLFVIGAHIRRIVWDPKEFLAPVYDWLDLTVGVDLFLVISGFVITRSLVDAMERGHAARRSHITAFWVRRIYRLLPTAWLWLFIAVLLTLVLRFMSDQLHLWVNDLPGIGAALLNGMNLYLGYCLFNSQVEFCGSSMQLHGHYWSLSLEEQFYLLFPVFFFFVNRRVFVLLLIAVVVAQFFWTRPMFTWFWLLRTDALCWGVLLAFASYTRPWTQCQAFFRRHQGLGLSLAVASVVSIPLVGAQVQGILTMKPYGVGLISLLCACAVFFAAIDYRPLEKDKGISRWMLYVGSRSYALYVIHYITFVFLRYAVAFSGLVEIETVAERMAFDLVICAMGLGITFAATELNYRFVETPWRNRGRGISARLLGPKKPSTAGLTEAASS